MFNSALSVDPLLSYKTTFFYFRFIIFSLVIWYFIDIDKNFLKVFCIFLLLTYFIALADGYYQYLFNESIFGYSSKLTRLNILLNDDLVLGSYLARLLPLLFGLIIFCYSNSKKYIFISLILLILSDVLVYLSGERTALGLLLISTIFIIIFIKKFKIIRATSLVLSLVFIFIISILSPEIKQRNIDYTISQLGLDENNIEAQENINPELGGVFIFSSQHHSLILTAWNMYKDKSIIGNGANSFRILCDKKRYSYDDYSCSTHPHNIYAQTLAELGVIGVIFIFIIIINLFIIFIKECLFQKNDKDNIPKSDFIVCLLACFIITLFPLVPSQNLFNNWVNIIYFMPVGIYLGIKKKPA